MTTFFDYPKSAKFGRVLPKSKIYTHAHASGRLKQLFVDQVDQISWAYKLAPETINLGATKAVSEIQIFTVKLRVPNVHEDVLKAIDKAIAFPIVFELRHGGKYKQVAAYKRPSEADSTKWVVSDYFESGWVGPEIMRQPMPSALNLGGLYDKLITNLLPHNLISSETGKGEPLPKRVEKVEAIRAMQREAERIKARLGREQQFNKRVAINAELREINKELKRLGGAAALQD